METIKNVLSGGNNDSNLSGEGTHLAGSTGQTGHDSLGERHTTDGVASNVPGAFPDVSVGGTREPTSYNESRSTEYGNTASRSRVDDNTSTSYDKTSSGGYGNTTSGDGLDEASIARNPPTPGEAMTGNFDTNERAMPPSTIRDERTEAVGQTYTARKFPLASGSESYGSDAPTGEAYATEVTSRLDDTMKRNRGDGDDGPRGSTIATGAGIVGATGAGTYGSQRDDDRRGGHTTRTGDRDDNRGYATGAGVGTAAAVGAGGAYSARELTSKNDDLGPAENTAGPHKSDTLNKADPRVQDDPGKARDMVLGLRKHPETGEEQVVMTDSQMDTHHKVVDPDEQRGGGDDEDNDEEGKKKGKGSKILGVFGIGKDKDKDKRSEDSGARDSSDTRDVGSSDYNKSSRGNERSEYDSTTAATSQSGYDQRPSESSYDRSRQDNTESRDSQDDNNGDNSDRKKKRGSLSGIFHRDNPNKLHKEPPPDHPSRRSGDNDNNNNTDSSRGEYTSSPPTLGTGSQIGTGPHMGIDGEIGRDREVSGYGGGDARQTTTIDEIQQSEQQGERQY